jgi:hypothetical protein
MVHLSGHFRLRKARKPREVQRRRSGSPLKIASSFAELLKDERKASEDKKGIEQSENVAARFIGRSWARNKEKGAGGREN